MLVDRVFCFWLGATDSHVATGGDSGGTRDIRFCKVANQVTEFIGKPPSGGRWRIELQAYPEYGLSGFPLEIARWTGKREGECALPHQYAGSPRAYPLWAMSDIRPLSSRSRVADAILLLHDLQSQFHARVVHREQLATFPPGLRAVLEEFDQCGRCITLSPPIELLDLPPHEGRTRRHEPPFDVLPRTKDVDALRARLRGLRGTGGRESAGSRHRRSRRLVETLKQLYDYRCQLCGTDTDVPRIDMGGGRFYCEVHHIAGFAEIDTVVARATITQERAPLDIDDAANVIVVCPYHHVLIHHRFGGFEFDRAHRRFIAPDGTILAVQRNKHL